jgi:hypothetical protein
MAYMPRFSRSESPTMLKTIPVTDIIIEMDLLIQKDLIANTNKTIAAIIPRIIHTAVGIPPCDVPLSSKKEPFIFLLLSFIYPKTGYYHYT